MNCLSRHSGLSLYNIFLLSTSKYDLSLIPGDKLNTHETKNVDFEQANGVFAFGVYVGGGLSSLSIAMAKGVGWRASCFIVACYGFLLSLLVRFSIREPVRAPSTARTSPGQSESNADKDYTIKQRYHFLLLLLLSHIRPIA